MEIYGFESSSVFNLLSVPAVNPINSSGKIDLSVNDWYKFEVASTAVGPFNNPYLPLASKAVLNTEFPNWLSPLNNALDVRGFYLSTSASECVGKQIIDGYCQHFTNWPTTYLHTVSPITKQEVAFTPETIFYAQSAYFVTIVMVQWSNVFACKSRKISFTFSGFNKHMFGGLLLETCIFIFLLYTPGVNKVFGGRPLPFFILGIPGLTFSMTLLIW